MGVVRGEGEVTVEIDLRAAPAPRRIDERGGPDLHLV
jgi:hypothetical protein